MMQHANRFEKNIYFCSITTATRMTVYNKDYKLLLFGNRKSMKKEASILEYKGYRTELKYMLGIGKLRGRIYLSETTRPIKETMLLQQAISVKRNNILSHWSNLSSTLSIFISDARHGMR